MESLMQDLRYGVRSLLRTPGFTAVVVVAMALGIGVNTMIFSVVNAILIRPFPFPDSDRIVLIQQTTPKEGENNLDLSFPDYLDFRERSKSFDGMGAWYESRAYLTIGGEPERFTSTVMSPTLLPALGIVPILGRNFLPEEEQDGRQWSTVILSHRIWSTRFGSDRTIIGRTLKMNGRVREVVGVMPPGFRFPETTDFFIPMGYVPKEESRGDHYLDVIARLKPGVTVAAAQAELAGMASAIAKQYPETSSGMGARVGNFHERESEDIKPMMSLLMAAVIFVLLIACANVANLMLARATGRSREIALRLALGAGRGRILRQLLTESVLVAIVGAALGVLIAHWGLDLVLSTIPMELPYWMKIDVDPVVLTYTLAISVLSGLLFGIAPALQASSARLHDTLKDGGHQTSGGKGRSRMRAGLVVAEISLTMVLLVGSGLMIRSFLRMQEARNNIQPEGLLTGTVTLPYAVYPLAEQKVAFFEDLLARVRALPRVESVGSVNILPLGRDSWNRGITLEGKEQDGPASWPTMFFAAIHPGYFESLGLGMIRGRPFGAEDRSGTVQVAIVNESAARRLWPAKDAIGQRFKFGAADTIGYRTVVGVVRDLRQSVRAKDRVAQVYVPHAQEPLQTMTLVVRSTSDPASLTAAIRRLVQSKDPDLPFYEVRTMPQVIREGLWEDRLYATLMSVFAALALVIAAVGIYGVMAYGVAQRTQEIGIRMALGAGRRDVVRMVVGQAMRLTALGVGLGLALAYAVTRLMASLLFGVSTGDPPTFVGVTVILALSALLAAWLPAHRATRVDPMVALRRE